MPSVRPASSGQGGGGVPGAHWLSHRPTRRAASRRPKPRLSASIAPSTYSAIPVSWPCTLASDAVAGSAARSMRSRPAPGTCTSRSRLAAAPIAGVKTRVMRISTSGSSDTTSLSSVTTMSQGTAKCVRTLSAKLAESATTKTTRSIDTSERRGQCNMVARRGAHFRQQREGQNRYAGGKAIVSLGRRRSIASSVMARAPSPRPSAFASTHLARVELDHQIGLHRHRIGHIRELGRAHEGALHLVVVDLEVVGHIALGRLHRLEDEGHQLRLVLDLDGVAVLDQVGADIDALAVD